MWGFDTFSLLSLSKSTSDVMKSLSRTRLNVMCSVFYSLSSSKWCFVLKLFRFVCILSCKSNARREVPVPPSTNSSPQITECVLWFVILVVYAKRYRASLFLIGVDLLMKLMTTTTTTTMMMMIRIIPLLHEYVHNTHTYPFIHTYVHTHTHTSVHLYIHSYVRTYRHMYSTYFVAYFKFSQQYNGTDHYFLAVSADII
jgi:hypothetical protein